MPTEKSIVPYKGGYALRKNVGDLSLMSNIKGKRNRLKHILKCHLDQKRITKTQYDIIIRQSKREPHTLQRLVALVHNGEPMQS